MGALKRLNYVWGYGLMVLSLSIFQQKGVSQCLVDYTTYNYFCDLDTLILEAVPVNGTAPFSFIWETGETTQSIHIPLALGDYMLTMTDATGCTSVINCHVKPFPSVLFYPYNQNACEGDTVTLWLDWFRDSIPGATYLWSTGETSWSIELTDDIVWSVTVTDPATGCDYVIPPGLFDFHPTPYPTIVGPNMLCTGQSVTLSVTGGPFGNIYWYPQGVYAPTIDITQPGTYVVYAWSPEAGYCFHTDTITILPGDIELPILNGPPSLCAGQNGVITVTNSPAYNGFVWNTGATTPSISVTQPGTYYVTVSDAGGCTAAGNYTINSGAGASISTTFVAATCGQNNGSIDLTTSPSGSYSFNWSNGNSTEDLTAIGGGTYSVTVTSPNGCTSTTNVILPDNPIAINISEIVSPVTSCAVNNGSIDVSISPTGTYTYLWSNGATTQDLSNLAAGNYSVTVSTGVNCTSMKNFVVTTMANVPELQSTPSPATCGESNGSIDLQVSNGQSPFTYLWSNGSITQDISSIAANTYSVTVTDANGCTSSSLTTVTENSIPINIASQVTPNTSCISSNGGIDLTISPIGNYAFLWSNGSTSEDLSGLNAGNYTVTVTLGLNCQQTASFDVTNQNIPFSISGNVTSNTSCTNPNGGIDVSVTPPGTYTYEWSSGVLSEDLLNIGPGHYDVSITNIDGCTLTSSFDVINAVPTMNITGITAPNSSCLNPNGSIDISVTPIGTYTFLWSNGSTSEDIQNVAQGNYSITVTNSNGCSTDSMFTVGNQSAGFTLSAATLSNTSCILPNGSIDLSVTPAGLYTYQWSNGATTEDLQTLTPGIYQVTVSDINQCSSSGIYSIADSVQFPLVSSTFTDESCGNSNGSIDLTVSPSGYSVGWSNGAISDDLQNLSSGVYSVIITLGDCAYMDTFIIANLNSNFVLAGTATDNTSCLLPNGSIDLTVTPAGNYSYVWSNGSTSEDLQNLSSGQYMVSVTDASNCLSTLPFNIADSSIIPLISETITPATCGQNNGSILLTTIPAAGNNFVWSNGSSNASLVNIAPGNYHVTVTSSSGCTSSKSFIVPNYNSAFSINGIVSANTSCIDSNGMIDLVITPAGNYTYAWSNGSSQPILQNLSSGNYIVTVTDAFLCSSIQSFNVDDSLSLPVISESISPATCGQGNGGIDISIATGGAYTYLWSNGHTDEDLSNAQPGIYAVTVTNASGCTATGIYTVPNANYSFTISSIVSDDRSCISPNGAIDITIIPSGTYSYLWSNGSSSEDLTGLISGIYQVTVTDINNCSTSELFGVENSSTMPLVSEIISPPTCGRTNGSIDLTIVPAGGNQILWSTGDTSEDLTSIAAGMYSVTIADVNGCTIESSYTIPGSDPLLVNIDAELLQSTDSMVTCSLILNRPLTMIDTIAWMPLELFSCQQRICTEQSFALVQSTQIFVMVTDTNGCIGTANLSLDVEKEIAVYIPNVFSPNDDGPNDRFTVYGNKEVEEIEELLIFDRWGNCVFINEKFPPSEPGYGWNGIYKGQLMNPAVFAYRALVRFTTGEERAFKGDVTLVR